MYLNSNEANNWLYRLYFAILSSPFLKIILINLNWGRYLGEVHDRRFRHVPPHLPKWGYMTEHSNDELKTQLTEYSQLQNKNNENEETTKNLLNQIEEFKDKLNAANISNDELKAQLTETNQLMSKKDVEISQHLEK